MAFAATTFTFKNILNVNTASVTLPQIVTISPTLVYNKDASLKAAAEDAIVVVDGGVIRVPLFGGKQYAEIPVGETLTIETATVDETVYYTNLITRYKDSKVVLAAIADGDANPAVAE